MMDDNLHREYANGARGIKYRKQYYLNWHAIICFKVIRRIDERENTKA
jgi:hypothetical protein